jgi:peptidoglycan/xylan/chitin deacetylase (PgdA/CDA1 family)
LGARAYLCGFWEGRPCADTRTEVVDDVSHGLTKEILAFPGARSRWPRFAVLVTVSVRWGGLLAGGGPPLTFPPQEFTRGNVNRATATLTFDCGASAVPTPSILDVLRREGIRTTFFLTGAWAAQNPDLARQIASEHELANHTYSHSDLVPMSDAQIRSEMERGESAVVAVTGRSSKPLWRAPFGSRTARVLQIATDLGWPYHTFWTADALDWQPISPEQVRTNMNRGAVNGGIVLAQCGSSQTAEILPQVMPTSVPKGSHSPRSPRSCASSPTPISPVGVFDSCTKLRPRRKPRP